MRLKFWQSEKTGTAAAQAAAVPVTPPVAKPVAATRSANAPGDLDLRLVWDALLRKKAWIIVPTAIVAALSFAIVNVITPRYKAEARLLVDGRENVFLRPNAERVEERRELDPEAITSQVQVVLSRDLAREIIRKNKLNERPEFDPILQG